jgi:arylsulfatase A-like enzyme
MPHLPISAPDSMRGKSRGGPYGDVIETLDWSVGEILRAVREQGMDGNTLVVFTSDNGPWHDLPPRMLAGGVEPWQTGSKSLFRAAKGTSYEGGFRVPGIFRWPGVVRPGQTPADMASTLDLFPTIARMAGAGMPADRVYDGHDLMPMLRDGASSPRKEFVYCQGPRVDGVREGPWKYREADAGPELYHVERDPAEMYNVAMREPEIVKRLAARRVAMIAEIGAK